MTAIHESMLVEREISASDSNVLYLQLNILEDEIRGSLVFDIIWEVDENLEGLFGLIK